MHDVQMFAWTELYESAKYIIVIDIFYKIHKKLNESDVNEQN